MSNSEDKKDTHAYTFTYTVRPSSCCTEIVLTFQRNTVVLKPATSLK
jgi:hypothetical protein